MGTNSDLDARQPQHPGRLRLVILAVLLVCLLSAPAAPQAQPGLEHRLKVALLFKIVQLVKWPAASGPLAVGVVGGGPLVQALSLVQGREVAGRPLVVRTFSGGSKVGGCDVLVVTAEAGAEAPRAIAAVLGSPVLTVGDGDRFLEQGGMMRLFVDGQRVQFAVGQDAIRRARLELDPALLQLASQPPVGER